MPSSLLPRLGVTWQAPTERDLNATLSIGGEDLTPHLRIDADGLIEWVRFDRWGDPDETGEWGFHPFGFEATETRQLGQFSIPAVGSTGWFHGTERWSEGEFFRCEITSLTPVE